MMKTWNGELAGYFGSACPSGCEEYTHVIPVRISSTHPMDVKPLPIGPEVETFPCPCCGRTEHK